MHVDAVGGWEDSSCRGGVSYNSLQCASNGVPACSVLNVQVWRPGPQVDNLQRAMGRLQLAGVCSNSSRGSCGFCRQLNTVTQTLCKSSTARTPQQLPAAVPAATSRRVEQTALCTVTIRTPSSRTTHNLGQLTFAACLCCIWCCSCTPASAVWQW